MSVFERRALALLGIHQQFHELSLRWRVVINQLPLLASIVVALTLVAAVSPGTYTATPFKVGLLLLAAASLAAVAVPWDRMFSQAYWVVPLLDFAAICGLYTGGRFAVTGLSFLCVFPVFWLAWSAAARRTAALLCFAATTVVVLTPLVLEGGTSAQELASPLLIPFMMVGIFMTVTIVQQDTAAQHRRLASADARLHNSLKETRRRSQLLDGVLETVDVGVTALDAEGRIVLMNNRQRDNHILAGMEGRPEASDEALIFGLDQVTLLAPEQRPAYRAMMGESFSDVIVWVGEGERQRALAVCARALRDKGRFAGSVLAYSDVTDMVNALNAREDFVSSVSHELRTPLTSIIGYLDLVLDDLDTGSVPAHVTSALQVAQRNAERLLLLVADLLTTASGTMHLHRTDTDVSELVRAALDAAQARSLAMGVVLHCACDEKLYARVDPDRISQVLDNLLSNAIKYSPDGGKVTISARAEGDQLVLEVEDAGIGMSEVDQREVFTKFFRTGQVKKAAIPGVGLGLVITKSIVEAHGGRISFESELRAGTTFRVELPMDPALRAPDIVG